MPGDLPASLSTLPWEAPRNFLGLESPEGDWASAANVILPIPYESSVSYGRGTGLGPEAILRASRYIELYDQELDREPWEAGVCTLPAIELSSAGADVAIPQLRQVYDALLAEAGERFVLGLGGEHSVSSAPILAHAARLDESARLSVLQFDAHTDLRTQYQGSRYSHAAVMAQVAGVCDITAVGIRAFTAEERDFAGERGGITIITADDMWEDDRWIERALETLGEDVYITFDVDYFDPSLVPSTGTPEPGGGDWYRTLRLLRRVFEERRVVGADVVELAPTPGFHAPDFLVAKLVYKMIGYKGRS